MPNPTSEGCSEGVANRASSRCWGRRILGSRRRSSAPGESGGASSSCWSLVTVTIAMTFPSRTARNSRPEGVRVARRLDRVSLLDSPELLEPVNGQVDRLGVGEEPVWGRHLGHVVDRVAPVAYPETVEVDGIESRGLAGRFFSQPVAALKLKRPGRERVEDLVVPARWDRPGSYPTLGD